MTYESYSLSQLGQALLEARDNYAETAELEAELSRRCNNIHHAQFLFNYHAKAYSREPNAQHFYEMYAMMSLVALMHTGSSQMGATA